MLDKFWETIGGKLTDRWAAVGVPALIFWLGGLLTWASGSGGLHKLTSPTGWLDRQATATQLAVIVTLLLAIAASGVIVGRLTNPVLRLLEGYWPRWLSWPRRQLSARVERQAAADEASWQKLAPHVLACPATATADQLAAWAHLERRRRRRPSAAFRYLPTRLGNILRASETRPTDKYGLDAVAVWPQLWLVLPETTRTELLAARAALDSAVGAVIWGLLFCIFTAWNLVALPAGLFVAFAAATIWAPPRAEIFADLVEAAFDMHRTALYQHLRWPLPVDPSQEHHQGQLLTAYLWRGSDDHQPTFTPPP